MRLGATIFLRDKFTPTLKKLHTDTQKAELSLKGLGKVRPVLRIRDEATLRINEIKRNLRSVERVVVRPTIRVAGIGFSIAGSAMRAATSLPALLGLGAGTYGGIISPLKFAGEMEQTRIGLETMLGSAEKADVFIRDLFAFAAKTPFDFPGLQESSKLLLAFGFQAEEVLPMMEAIGNAAAGLGKGAEGINRATIALGQMRAKGKVSAEEMLQLTELGIPAWDILADAMSVTTAQAQELVSKGVVPVDKAIKALIHGMNIRFPDMMKRQNQSLLGLWSNIQDVFSTKILLRWGEGLSMSVMPRLEKIADMFDNNEEAVDSFGRRLEDIAKEGADALLTRIEGTLYYLKDLFNDPEFSQLDFWGKINFLWDEAVNKTSEWWDSSGREKFITIGSNIGSFIGEGLATILPMVGQTAAITLLNTFENTLRESKLGAILAGAIAGGTIGSFIPGLGTAVGFGIGGVSGIFSKMFTDIIGEIQRVSNEGGVSRAFGVPYIPRDNYLINAHRGEALLSRNEADRYRQGAATINITILKLADVIHANNEPDIDRLLNALEDRLLTVASNMATSSNY